MIQQVCPRTRRVQCETSANIERLVGETVERSHTDDVRPTPKIMLCFDVVACDRTLGDCCLDEGKDEACGVVHLAIFEHDRAAQLRRAQMRMELQDLHTREEAGSIDSTCRIDDAV